MIGHYEHFPEKVYLLTWKIVIGCSSSHVQEQYTTARRFLQDAVIHSRSFIPKTLLKSASQDETNVLCMTDCRWYQVIVPVCVRVDRIFLSFRSVTGGHETRRAVTGVIKFRNSRISDKALCRKREALVGNDKALSETTSACRKRQSLFGNDKALSANLSLSQKNLRRSISLPYVPCRNKNDKHMLVGLCRFFVVLFYVNGE